MTDPEVTLEEVLHRINEGELYYDYDWAIGPATSAIKRAIAELQANRDRLRTQEFNDRAADLFSQRGSKMSGMISVARDLVAEFGSNSK